MKSKTTTKEDVIKMVEYNHIWLNAFSCIKPTPEFCKDIGEQIINMLNEKSRLLPAFDYAKKGMDDRTKKTMQELSELTPVLYLSINKS